MKTKIKYGLVALHIGFWLLNYMYVTSGNLGWNGFSNADGSLTVAYSYGLFFNALLFYTQVFWLVPKYYVKDRKIQFWLISIGLLFFATLIESILDIKVTQHFEIDKRIDLPLAAFFVAWVFHNFIFHFLYSIVGFFYQFFFEYRKSEEASKAILRETHASELKYLKAQLNPHFLFNGINSVYHLIGKNNASAKDTLLQFSGLLRYQLYESSEAFIRLDKELDYVAKFIQMERVRKGEDIELIFEIDFEHPFLQIAPLLLTPFIENAFKHISHHEQNSENQIQIQIIEQQKELELIVKNTCDRSKAKQSFGGVGLANVQRRLELLYPEKHHLQIDQGSETYEVQLKIDLT